VRRCVICKQSQNCDLSKKFLIFYETCAFMSRIMFYKMLFDRFVDFIFFYTVLDVPRQNCTVRSTNVSVLCFVNSDSVLSKTQHRASATKTLLTVCVYCVIFQCSRHMNHVRLFTNRSQPMHLVDRQW